MNKFAVDQLFKRVRSQDYPELSLQSKKRFNQCVICCKFFSGFSIRKLESHLKSNHYQEFCKFSLHLLEPIYEAEIASASDDVGSGNIKPESLNADENEMTIDQNCMANENIADEVDTCEIIPVDSNQKQVHSYFKFKNRESIWSERIRRWKWTTTRECLLCGKTLQENSIKDLKSHLLYFHYKEYTESVVENPVKETKKEMFEEKISNSEEQLNPPNKTNQVYQPQNWQEIVNTISAISMSVFRNMLSPVLQELELIKSRIEIEKTNQK